MERVYKHPIVKTTGAILLIILGVIMLVTPGPGLLTIAVGLVWLGVLEKDDIKRWVRTARAKLRGKR